MCTHFFLLFYQTTSRTSTGANTTRWLMFIGSSKLVSRHIKQTHDLDPNSVVTEGWTPSSDPSPVERKVQYKRRRPYYTNGSMFHSEQYIYIYRYIWLYMNDICITHVSYISYKMYNTPQIIEFYAELSKFNIQVDLLVGRGSELIWKRRNVEDKLRKICKTKKKA